MKRVIAGLISLLLSLSALSVGTYAQTVKSVTAQPASSSVLINGKNVSFEAYNITGNNYFKLRDIAVVLSGTLKKFDIVWDSEKNTITLTSGKEYCIEAGGEMSDKVSGNKLAMPTNSTIYFDLREISFQSYNINGSNYFMLRDIGRAMDFCVDWDAAANVISIDTSKGYCVTNNSDLESGSNGIRKVDIEKISESIQNRVEKTMVTNSDNGKSIVSLSKR